MSTGFRTAVLAISLGGMALVLQAPPAHAGFFDELGSAFGHLGQAAAGHKLSYEPGKASRSATKPGPVDPGLVDPGLVDSGVAGQVAAVPPADGTRPLPPLRN